MNDLCDKCKHNKVCKYKDEFRRYLKDVNTIVHGSFIINKIDCLYRTDREAILTREVHK